MLTTHKNTFCITFFVILSLVFVQAQPVVKIVSPYAIPDSGCVSRGTVAFSAKVSSSRAIKKVCFYIDNKLVETDSIAPYGLLWNTRKSSPGAHTLSVVAYDDLTSATVSLTDTVKSELKFNTASRGACTRGLLPNLTTPLIDSLHMRDFSICPGADSAYYLAGSLSDNNIWVHNEGVNLWRSYDLINWKYIGLVWSFEGDASQTDKIWRNLYTRPFRAAWSPLMKYSDGRYYIIFSNPLLGSRILVSEGNRPEGPYRYLITDPNSNAGDYLNDKSMKNTVCFKYLNSGNYFNYKGVNYLSIVNQSTVNNRYSSWVALTDTTLNWRKWHEALPCGGGASYFTDSKGQLWATLFGNDDQAPWYQKPCIVKLNQKSDSTLTVSADQSLPASVLPSCPVLTQARPGNKSVEISWNLATGADSYLVKRADNTGGPYVRIATVSNQLFQYTDTGVLNHKTYFYIVISHNSIAESTGSNEISATPSDTLLDIPANVNAVAGSGQVTISWSSINGVFYTVKRSMTKGGIYNVIATNLNSNSYTDTTVVNGSRYYYVVSAKKGINEGINSIEVSDVPLPAYAVTPAGVVAVALPGAVMINWNPSLNASIYNVYRAVKSGGPYLFLNSVSNSTSFRDSLISYGKTCYYVITASNFSGETGRSAEVSCTPALDIPDNIKVIPGDSKLTLSWNQVAGASGYDVYYPTVSGGTKIQSLSANYLAWTISNLINGTKYYISIVAKSSSGNSPKSTELVGVPMPAYPLPTPSVTVEVSGNKSSLNWASAIAATSYYVGRSLISGGPYTMVSPVLSALNYSDSNLSNNSAYYYVVYSSNMRGLSEASYEVGSSTGLTLLENPEVDHIMIYPNPAGKYTNIYDVKSAVIKIYNMNGTLIQESKSDSFSHTVDVSQIAAGLYIIEVIKNGKSSRLKLLVRK